ncbi:MAG TPA: hypothetical protein VND64_23735 [Pirellulales bacterium]|nr:hypothetical protein [Pirellulales bacterium]
MPRPRFQFRLSTLLWITLAVACWFGGWFGGMWFERWRLQQELSAPAPWFRFDPQGGWPDPPKNASDA